MVVGPLLLAAIFAPPHWRLGLLLAAGAVTLIAATIFLMIAWLVRHERRRIEAFVSASKHDFSQPAQRELRRLWSGFTSLTPNLRKLRAALREHGLLQPGQATVVVFDTMEPREAHPYSFDPVILTPTQRIGWRVAAIGVCVLLVLMWLLGRVTSI